MKYYEYIHLLNNIHAILFSRANEMLFSFIKIIFKPFYLFSKIPLLFKISAKVYCTRNLAVITKPFGK